MRGDADRVRPKVTLRDVPSAAEGLFAEVWTALERRFGITFPTGTRRRAESLYVGFVDRGGYDLRVDADRAAQQQHFASFAKEHLLALARQEPIHQPQVRVPKSEGQEPARKREREKNEKLLSFVAERVLPFRQLLDGQLKPGRLGRQGVPWEALHTEWNRTQSYWIMSREALKVEYYAAARNPYLAGALLRQVDSEVSEEWREQQGALDDTRAHVAALPDELRAKWDAPVEPIVLSPRETAELERLHEKLRESRNRTRARFRSEEDYQAWRAKRDAEREEEYRASLTRRDLIAERVAMLVWRIPGDDPEKDTRLWQTPLRDWFIAEARGAPVRLHWWSWHRRARESGGDQ
jgi:hypothetical protein